MNRARVKIKLAGLATLLLFSSLVSLSACEEGIATSGGTTVPGGDPGKTTVGGGGSADVADTSKKLWMQVDTSWEVSPDKYVTQGSCSVPDDSPIEGDPVECTMAIPEGRLHFSNLKITVGTNSADTCSIIDFVPYYYVASISATFNPPWTTTSVACDTSPLPTDCFSGAGTEMIPGFPENTGVYYIASPDALSTSYVASSANIKKRDSNRWTANNLDPARRALALVATDIFGALVNPNWVPRQGVNALAGYRDEFIGTNVFSGAFKDYLVTCADAHYEPLYQIKLTISDKDTPTGPNASDGTDNQITTWENMQ